MNTLDYVLQRFGVTLQPDQKLPIDLFNSSRRDLALLFHELKFKKGAEIGVESGEYSETLVSLNPGLELYCIDAWKAYRGYRDHVSQEKIDGFYETAQHRLSRYGAELIRKFSMDAVQDFKDNGLDFVYIDANHSFDYVIMDIIEWSKKVKPGGIVAGHDYVRRKNITDRVHVVQAVQSYTYCHDIETWFTVGGAAKETRSWFWVKP